MKSHFKFTKKQRNGIFLLIACIIALQIGIFFHASSNDTEIIISEDIQNWQSEIDSLKQIKLAVSKPKLNPFNPNFITDYKGYTLGMSSEEIDRLHNYRAQDKWINSSIEFQEVTQISDSLLNEISTYFKFPDWVANPKPKPYNKPQYSNAPKTFAQKIDLNQASTSQLLKVYGVGEKLSDRIVRYRIKQNGFIADIELMEVYGLSSEVIERIKEQFTVKTPKPIVKFNLNTSTKAELVTIPYIDYEVAYNIIEERTLRDGYKSLDELTKVKDFPVHKIEIIKLYLTLD